MKYCRYCGQQLSDEAVFCSRCGRAVNVPTQAPSAPVQKKSTNVVCILGFVFSLLGSFTIVGLILSIVGYNQVKDTDDSTGKALSKAGIIISSVIIGLVIFLYIILFSVLFGL